MKNKEILKNLKTLEVEAKPLFLENCVIDGEYDDEYGTLTPCLENGVWKPIIDIETGTIVNWEKGKNVRINYKVCDNGNYKFLDENGNVLKFLEQKYVPKIMSPSEKGYGDYIFMEVDSEGKIQDWEIILDDVFKFED